MKKEFVSYEIALALKELGFDEPCFWWYDFEGNLRQDNYTTNNNSKYFTEGNSCSAQLFQQAFRFFRKKYNLYDNIGIVEKWSFEIEHIPFSYDKESIHSKNDYDTYEQAELECLKQLIKIAKQKL